MRLAEGVLADARERIGARLGLDFWGTQAARLEEGLEGALRAAAVSAADAEAYLNWLWSLPEGRPEWRRFAAHFTVGETYFFRDPAYWEVLAGTILPDLIARCGQHDHPRLRLWSAGCSTGEEPYSLAMIMDHLLAGSAIPVDIVATDINAAALETARRGIYREWSLRATPSWFQQRHFVRGRGGAYALDPKIRGMVTFFSHNLAADREPPGPVGDWDMVLCRNVLMYFTPEKARRTITRLQSVLADDGWLVTAPAEASAGAFRALTPVNFPEAILFHKRAVSRPSPVGNARVPCPLPDEESNPVDPLGRPGLASVIAAPADTSSNSSGLLARARCLANAGHLSEARNACDAALARDGLDPEAYGLLAIISQEQGDDGAARDALRRVLYLDPNAAWAHFLLGALLLRQGEQSRGTRHLEQVEQLLTAALPDHRIPGTDVSAPYLLDATRAFLHSRRSGR